MAKKRRYYQKSGLYGLMSRVRAGGLAAIDQRSAGARALLEWKAELVADLGGEVGLSSQKKMVVEMAMRARLLVDSIDTWLMRQERLVNQRRRSVYPVIQQRTVLVNHLVALLKELGFERQAKPVKSLTEYIQQRNAAEVVDEDDDDSPSHERQDAVPADLQEKIIRGR